MKKISIPRLKKEADKRFSLEVRTRDKFTCQKCGKQNKHVHCAHVFSRNRLSVRYEMDNAITLCYYCHIIWSHRCPVEFAEWCRDRLGDRYLELKTQADIIITDPREFLENKWNSQSLKPAVTTTTEH